MPLLTATFNTAYATVGLVVDGALWPTPAVRTNAIRNPAVGAAITDWTSIAGTSGVAAITRPTAATLPDSTTGPNCLVTWSTATTVVSGGFDVDSGPAAVPTAAVARYGAVYVKPSITQRLRVIAQHRTDILGVVGTDGLGTEVVCAANVWTRLEVSFTSPSTATREILGVRAVVGTSGVVWPIGSTLAGVRAQLSEAVGAYFDGSTPNAASTVYAWSGAANASTSTATVPAVTNITITRLVAGEAGITVRGISSLPVVGGYFVGSDPEAPLASSVSYRVDGYATAVFVSTATVTVSTAGAAQGLWLKVPGTPDATVLARFRGISDVTSPTIGGVYQIVGGGTVSQTTANWSGIESEQATVSLSVAAGAEVDRLRAVLALSRVLLLQPAGSTDLDPGWYYVSNVKRSNPAQTESFTRRWFELNLVRVGIPAGNGQGIPGITWAAVVDTYATWTALMSARATWFDVLKGL